MGEGNELQTRRRQFKRVQFIGVGVVFAVAVVTAVSFSLVSGAQEGSSAIGRVKDAVAPTLADHRQQARAAGGTFAVSWSATPMAGGHMVETTIRSTVQTLAGRAVFMVASGSAVVTPLDTHAAALLGPGATPMPHS